MKYVVFAAALVAVGLLSACAGLASPSPVAKIDAQGGTVTASNAANDDTLVLDIKSEKGVGSAEVTLAPGPRPRNLIMRIHLKGLEEFRFGYGDTTVLASVTSSGDPPITDRVREGYILMDGPVQLIDDKDPRWMDVRVVGDSQAIPLAEGDYFEVEAPGDFLQGSETTFRLNWVDFYR
jgi:hypothetical protein